MLHTREERTGERNVGGIEGGGGIRPTKTTGKNGWSLFEYYIYEGKQ